MRVEAELFPFQFGERVVYLSKDDASLLLDMLADLEVRRDALIEVERIAGRRGHGPVGSPNITEKISAYRRAARLPRLLDETA